MITVRLKKNLLRGLDLFNYDILFETIVKRYNQLYDNHQDIKKVLEPFVKRRNGGYINNNQGCPEGVLGEGVLGEGA